VIIVDPVELLDILGNENRRRILQLLSFRPFYFNEMAKRLDVGPKAVIDHLEMLERAGLIECFRDQSRRKYFRIARKTVVEIAVSPHSYGVRAYRSENTDAGTPMPRDMKNLQEELDQIEIARKNLRKQLEVLEEKDMNIKRHAAAAIQEFAEDKLEAEIMVALLSGGTTATSLAQKLEVPIVVVEERLKRLQSRGAVNVAGGLWSI
jgi:ArsR family transcriptional regulator